MYITGSHNLIINNFVEVSLTTAMGYKFNSRTQHKIIWHQNNLNT